MIFPFSLSYAHSQKEFSTRSLFTQLCELSLLFSFCFPSDQKHSTAAERLHGPFRRGLMMLFRFPICFSRRVLNTKQSHCETSPSIFHLIYHLAVRCGVCTPPLIVIVYSICFARILRSTRRARHKPEA